MAQTRNNKRRFVAWLRKPENWFQIITCVGVVVTLHLAIKRHYAIDEPISARTLHQLDAEAALQDRRKAGLDAETRLARVTANDIEDPIRAKVSEVQLRTARLQEAREVDQLLDSITPDFRVKMSQAVDGDETLWLPFEISNGGTRGVQLERVEFVASGYREGASRGVPVDSKLESCSIGCLGPGATIGCTAAVPQPKSDKYVKLKYRLKVVVTTYKAHGSESARLLQEVLPERAVRDRQTRVTSFDGIWLFDW